MSPQRRASDDAGFGPRLAAWRRGHGYSQRALGRQLQLSQGRIQDVESGRFVPSDAWVRANAQKLGIPPAVWRPGLGA